MSYSTNTTITLILPGLPQTTSAAGHSTTLALVDQHIARADNVINGKIAIRYNVANFTSTVPPLVKTISEDITSYFTYRSLFSSDNQNLNEWTDKYKESIQMLDDIRNGDMDLIDENGNIIGEKETSDVDKIESTTQDYQPFFDEDEPIEWAVDGDKLTNIKDNR